tara:strand:- start:16166 stop:16804 length:639 start_codon:yes stop_codon:yes gene_type:complete
MKFKNIFPLYSIMKVLNQISKGGKMLKPLLRSKVLLYFLSIVSILNILFFGYLKDYQSVFAFIIIALLMSFFSKNMIIILFVAIALSNLIKFALHKRFEGLENMEEEDKKKENMEDMDEDMLDTPEFDKKLSDSLDRVSDKEISKMEKEEEKELDQAKKEEKQALYNDLKNDMVEFEELQRNIMNNMKEIDPLLTKAETFVEKFEGYKKKLN